MTVAVTTAALSMADLGCESTSPHDAGNSLNEFSLPQRPSFVSFAVSETLRSEDLQLLQTKGVRLVALRDQIITLAERYERLFIVSEFIDEAYANIILTQHSVVRLTAEAHSCNDTATMSAVAELMRQQAPVDDKCLEMLMELNATKSDSAAYVSVVQFVRASDVDSQVLAVLRAYTPHALEKYEIFKPLLK